MPDSTRVSELAYALVDSDDLDAWRRLAGDVLGMEVRDPNGGLELAFDSRPWRLVVQGTCDRGGVRRIGWLAVDKTALTSIRDEATAAGFAVSNLEGSTLEHRGVEAGFAFADSSGFVHEVVTGYAAPNSSPGRFVTGDQGMGHIVFLVSDISGLDEVYLGLFRMALREDMMTQVGSRGHFYGCNPRHHSAAAVGSLPQGSVASVAHIMVEYPSIDDVGCAFDRAEKAGFPVRTALGRHRTDHMLSFYLPTPSGFDFEVGCEGLRVDDTDWAETKEQRRAPLWGHGGIRTLGAPLQK